jgi:hypothetical protein
MDNNAILATLKSRLFHEHGTSEVKLKKPVVTGTQDWRAGGGDPTCTKVRAVDEKEFFWYLNDWAYGWYGEDDYSNGVDGGHLTTDLKIKILTQALGVSRKSVEEKREDALPYEDAKRAYELLHKERDTTKWELARKQELIPEEEEYLGNEAMYKLWTMRKSTKAISYKEMYDIVEHLLDLIDQAESMARSAGWRE